MLGCVEKERQVQKRIEGDIVPLGASYAIVNRIHLVYKFEIEGNMHSVTFSIPRSWEKLSKEDLESFMAADYQTWNIEQNKIDCEKFLKGE